MADIRRRDELPDRERAVSDALDELNHAMHGLTASWAYPIEFLEMLAERGFAVIPQREVPTPEQAEAAVTRVRELHKREVHTSGTSYCYECCDGVIYPWPCDTIRALDGEE